MIKEWSYINRMWKDKTIIVNKITVVEDDVAVEGEFHMPPLARLSEEAQLFVAAFVSCHGSIKEMEKLFGVSYPTIKNRLNSLKEQLSMVEINELPSFITEEKSTVADPLEQLSKGELSVEETIRKLKDKRS